MEEQKLTMAHGLRMMELLSFKNTWKDIDKEEVHNEIVKTRGCFQTTCSEWDSTTMAEKIQLLKELVNDKGYDSLQLSMQMMEIYNTQFGKEIKEIDLLMGMSRILDHLLKDNLKNDVEK